MVSVQAPLPPAGGVNSHAVPEARFPTTALPVQIALAVEHNLTARDLSVTRLPRKAVQDLLSPAAALLGQLKHRAATIVDSRVGVAQPPRNSAGVGCAVATIPLLPSAAPPNNPYLSLFGTDVVNLAPGTGKRKKARSLAPISNAPRPLRPKTAPTVLQIRPTASTAAIYLQSTQYPACAA
jgi:hypothetical protein